MLSYNVMFAQCEVKALGSVYRVTGSYLHKRTYRKYFLVVGTLTLPPFATFTKHD